jgi:hypothetical protein
MYPFYSARLHFFPDQRIPFTIYVKQGYAALGDYITSHITHPQSGRLEKWAELWNICLFVCLFCGSGAWTQGLHLRPLHQPIFVMGFFQDRVSWTVCPGWLGTAIFLISASWVARIIGVSHWCPANICYLKKGREIKAWRTCLQEVMIWIWNDPHRLMCLMLSSQLVGLFLHVLETLRGEAWLGE